MSNEEIKEILTSMHYAGHTFASYRMKSVDILTLLDYITNLQEENERLKNEKPEYILRWKLEEQLEDYKSRNEKAINFIEEKISSTKGVVDDYMHHKEHNKVLIELLQEDIEIYKKELNILNGGDKDV